MNKHDSWEKKILLPGLFLSVAALGLLFLLQIRWMNNSLWSENMRYRREAVESVNRIGRFTMDNLKLDSLNSFDPQKSLNDWRLNAPYPELVKDFFLLGNENPGDFDAFLAGHDLLYLTGQNKPQVAYLLDGDLLYETIFLGNLKEYASDYTFSLDYRELVLPETGDANFAEDNGVFRKSVFFTFLPRIFDGEDARMMGNLLSFGPEGEGPKFRDPPGTILPYLTLNLNDSRGSELFVLRLRRFNIGLIITLSLILLGSYSLLFRLYRDEETQRRAGQTFVASVSHELRTPIAVIKSASDNLFRGVVEEKEKVRSYGSLIGQEAERLNRMVESILYYSRLEGGEGLVKLNWEEVNPREYTNEILTSIELTNPGQTLNKELAGSPERVRIDKEAFRMIVENLVLNGLVHGSGSPVRVRIESYFPSQWSIVVEDEGPGIPKKEQKGIFDPFVRGRLSMTNQIKGSGLGLHLAKTAANGMGGTVRLESPYEFPAGAEKKGSRFQLILPLIKEGVK